MLKMPTWVWAAGYRRTLSTFKPGETVVDLGSGAGNDVFIARRIVGANGKVIGIDMTQAMIELARENAGKLGAENVEFRLGDIEHMPIDDNTADVVVSNCVINLVPDKLKAFQEIYRMLKPRGRFGISDIVITGSCRPKYNRQRKCMLAVLPER